MKLSSNQKRTYLALTLILLGGGLLFSPFIFTTPFGVGVVMILTGASMGVCGLIMSCILTAEDEWNLFNHRKPSALRRKLKRFRDWFYTDDV